MDEFTRKKYGPLFKSLQKLTDLIQKIDGQLPLPAIKDLNSSAETALKQ